MTGSPSPSTISVPRTLNIELMGFCRLNCLAIGLSDVESVISISWGAIVGVLIKFCSWKENRVKESFDKSFWWKAKGYGTLKLRVNLCRGGRKGDAGENLRVLL
jgi:hypothetical protein